MTTPAPWQGRYVVYRLFDADERLIYIGCSRSLEMRLRTHQASWFGWSINRVTVKLAPDKETALQWEAAAILAENPRWNRAGRRPRRDWTHEEYLDYLTVLDHQPCMPERMKRIRRECEIRFGSSERAA